MDHIMSPELKEVLMNVLEIDSVSEQDSAETIRTWDSVRQINLMMAIEEKFGITFPVEEMPELTSVKAIAAAIESRRR